MKQLLVGSVFGPTERSRTWLRLQRQFLAKTTDSYDHVVFVNGNDLSPYRGVKVIGRSEEDPTALHRRHPHVAGLRALLAYFRRHRYKHYLILDSDCFPIAKGWLAHLQSTMKMTGHKIAAPLRTENLDIFPHPCAFYIRGSAVRDPSIDFHPRVKKNLMGIRSLDPGMAIPRTKCFPLMRSNARNPHPIFAAIYHHLFYHHGCGSRRASGRAIKLGYLDHIVPRDAHARIEQQLYRRLVKNPDAFISWLTGRIAPWRNAKARLRRSSGSSRLRTA